MLTAEGEPVIASGRGRGGRRGGNLFIGRIQGNGDVASAGGVAQAMTSLPPSVESV